MERIIGTKAIRKCETPNSPLRLVLLNIVISVCHNAKGQLEAPNFIIEPILTPILWTSQSRELRHESFVAISVITF